MMYRREWFYRGLIYFAAVFCAVGNVICSRNSWGMTGIKITALDAVLVYDMVGLKRLALPLLIAYLSMHRFKWDFNYSYLVRSKSRLSIWYRHMANMTVDCIVVATLMMAAGAVTGYIVCDEVVDFYSNASVCRYEFEKNGMFVPDDMNIPVMLIDMYIINVGELIARTLVIFLVYWLTGSRVAGIIGAVLFSNIIIGEMGRSIIWFGDLGRTRYYSGLYFPDMVMETLLLITATIVLVLLTAQIYVPAKEFIKEHGK